MRISLLRRNPSNIHRNCVLLKCVFLDVNRKNWDINSLVMMMLISLTILKMCGQNCVLKMEKQKQKIRTKHVKFTATAKHFAADNGCLCLLNVCTQWKCSFYTHFFGCNFHPINKKKKNTDRKEKCYVSPPHQLCELLPRREIEFGHHRTQESSMHSFLAHPNTNFSLFSRFLCTYLYIFSVSIRFSMCPCMGLVCVLASVYACLICVYTAKTYHVCWCSRFVSDSFDKLRRNNNNNYGMVMWNAYRF